MRPYKDSEYAANRLGGCIVRTTSGVPVKVVGLVDGSTFHCTKLTNARKVLVDNEDLDITPVPLGFVNTEDSCTYLTRMPMREDWRQGLRANNARTLMGRHFNELLLSELARTIDNKYPKYADCVDSVKGNTFVRRAFHRQWAVGEGVGSPVLYHRATVVGKVSVENQPVLDEKYHYLDRKLEEAILAAS